MSNPSKRNCRTGDEQRVEVGKSARVERQKERARFEVVEETEAHAETVNYSSSFLDEPVMSDSELVPPPSAILT
jgi:hypothetical protein